MGNVGQICNLRRISNPPGRRQHGLVRRFNRPIENRPQDAILPHILGARP